MEKDKSILRLTALDGLRGFAILLVFLNHITTGYITKFIPYDLMGWFFGDGVNGVTFLFILSGFLMAYIYPQPVSSLGFIQKRYTRIFPLFISMSLIMLIYRLYPKNSPLFFVLIILTLGVVVHLLWVRIVKFRSDFFKRGLFLSFVLLQSVVGLTYVLWVMRHPPLVFNQLLPVPIREAFIFFTNATLTLPLGNYVPMLDGVYWTLVAEVLFYILYPIFIVPILTFTKSKPRIFKYSFFVSVILLIMGTDLLSHKILLVSMIQPALWLYFVTGIILANIYKHKSRVFSIVTDSFANIPLLGSGFIFFGVLLLEHYCEVYLPDAYGPWIRMSFAIPLTLLVATLLNSKTSLHRFFNRKFWVFLGTVSYSLYLSHALIVHIAERIYTPTDFWTNLIYVIITFGVAVIAACILYFLLEKPYFRHPVQVKSAAKDIAVKKYRRLPVLTLISVGYLAAIFIAFQSQFNFFSVVRPILNQNYSKKSVPQKILPIKNGTSFTISFRATGDNLGLISARIMHTKTVPTDQQLVFTLRQDGVSKPLATTRYTLDYFNSGAVFPFGFAPIKDSVNKSYTAELSLSDKFSSDFVNVDTTSFQVVYPADKKRLLTNPNEMARFLRQKVVAVFDNDQARIIFLLGLPFILLSLTLLKKDK